MLAELSGASIELTPEGYRELARHVVDEMESRGLVSEADGWIHGAEAAAKYLGCKRKRVYTLLELGRLEHRKDGRAYVFKREWLDAAMERDR